MKVMLIATVALLLACCACGGYSNSMGNAPAADPSFSPAPGTFTSVQNVTISDSTPNAVIYYTIDGTTPTTASLVYHGPIPVLQTTTIKAIAVASGYSMSNVVTAAYIIM